MAYESRRSRAWVPELVERRLEAVETTLSVIAAWNERPSQYTDVPIEPRLADEALDVGWHELMGLLGDLEVSHELLDRLVDVCERAVDLWWVRDPPHPYARTVEALAFSILDLDEEFFIPVDYDPDAEEDGPRCTYRIPWWFGL